MGKDFWMLVVPIIKMEDKIVKQDIGMVEEMFEMTKNMVSFESHCMGSYISTKNSRWLERMKFMRKKRTKYLSLIAQNQEGQSWCCSKHLLEIAMRLQEISTRFLSTNQLEEAKVTSEEAGDMYLLFLEINKYLEDKKNDVPKQKSSA